MATQSTGYAEQLLRLRNKQTQPQTDQTQNTVPGLATFNYNNIYDQLNDKFSNSHNYNAQAFHDALLNGELGLYLNLLSKNPDTQVENSKFYDPKYYNYEAQIAELALLSGDIDNEKLVSREVWDNKIGDYVKQDMTEYDYNRYQLNEYYTNRDFQIKRQIEAYEKSQMSDIQKFGNSILATLGELGEGAARFLANIGDLVLSPLMATGDALINGKDWAQAFTDWFAHGFSASEQNTLRNALNEYERTKTDMMDLDGNYQGIGKYAASIANSIGYMLPSMVLGAFTGGGTLWFGAGILGSNLYDNLTNDNLKNVPFGAKIANATIKAVAETAIEWGLAKLLGPTLEDTLKNIKPSAGKLAGAVSKTATTLTKSALTKRGVKSLFTDALQEGLEEFLQDGTNGLIDAFMDMQYEGFGNDDFNFQTLMDSFTMGALTSIVLGGIGTPLKSRFNAIYVNEGQNNYKRLGGFAYRGMSDILARYSEAAKAVQEGKIKGQEAIDIGVDLYKITTQIAPFFATLTPDRIKRADQLLQRVQQNADAKTETLFEGKTLLKGKYATRVMNGNDMEASFRNDTTVAQYYGKQLGKMLNEAIAVNNISAKLTKKLKNVLDKNKDKLTNNGVTTVDDIVTAENIENKKTKKKEKSEAVKEAEKILAPKYDDLLKQYEGIVLIDGHIAVDGEGIIFVPQAWLENYTTSEIYKFLAQQRIFDTLSVTAEFMGINSAMTEHYRQFSGNANATTEEALMNTLFNQSVYEHFLLTGDNAHKYKDYAFRLHEIISDLANKGNLTAEQKALVEKTYEDIKNTMRIPVLKAILNWNMEPQKIGADSVLTKTDKDLVLQYQARHKTFSSSVNTGKINANNAYILENTKDMFKLTDVEIDIMNKGFRIDASERDRYIAVAMATMLDRRNSRDMKNPMFFVPVKALSVNEQLSAADIEYLSTCINDINSIYNIDIDTFTYGSEIPQKMLKDMQALGIESGLDFLARRLEGEIGANYVVIPVEENGKTTLQIFVKMQSDTILNQGIILTEQITEVEQDLSKLLKAEYRDLLNNKWTIRWAKEGELQANEYGSTDYKNHAVLIDKNTSSLEGTLTHELNHVIHKEKGVVNTGIYANQDEFFKTYDILLELEQRMYPLFTIEECKNDILYTLELYEVLARASSHRNKVIRPSFAVPNVGRPGFEIVKRNTSSQQSANPYANYSNEERAFLDVLDQFEDYEYNALRDRNTFHSRFNSNTTSKEIFDKLVKPNIPWQIAAKMTLDDIITQANMLLSDDILATIEGEITEGKIAQAVKHYIEENYKGISIDRDGITHDYILVNDNAFDDFLLPNVLNKAIDDEGDDFVKKSKSENGLSLNQFYRMLPLTQLGLPSDIKVIANDNVKRTETKRTKDYPNGVIYIKTDSLMTNAEFIDKLNHEFRHLMQLHSKLEQGFTNNFEVTAEMIADMKKHLPNLFKDKRIRQMFNTDEKIVQNYIYRLTGGELQGYGFDIAQKPVYVEEKGGQPTIYMPWYDSKTGEGRYNTKYIGSRALDRNEQEQQKKEKQKRKTENFSKMKVDKKPKTKRIITPEGTIKYQSNLKRNFTREEAANDNRKYFLRKGIRPQMDPDLQEFVIKTTGHLKDLPEDLRFAIKSGQLNKDKLFKWFRTVDSKLVNDFTFNLMNEVFFHNDTINSMEELQSLINDTESMIDWNIIFHLLLEEGLDEEFAYIQNDLTKAKQFYERMKLTEQFGKKLEQRKKRVLQPGKGRKDFEVTPEMENAMRMVLMKYFDGSLAGAAYSANILFNLVYKLRYHYQGNEGQVSLNAKSNKNGAKKARDGEGSEFGDLLSVDNTMNIGMSTYSRDVMQLYNEEVADVDVDTMLDEVVNYAKETKGEEFAVKLVKAYTKDGEFNPQMYNKLVEQFSVITLGRMTGYRPGSMTPVGNVNTTRERIAKNAKRFATQLIKRVAPADWKNLPQEVQDMFQEVDGKKKLKSEVYSVGRGRVKGKSGPRDTQHIFNNMNLLKQTVADAKAGVFTNRDVAKSVKKTQERLNKEIEKVREINKTLSQPAPSKTVVIKVKDTKNRAINEKNEFTIVSSKPMPNVLKDIYDTSFNKLADDKVQFLSKDKDGNYYEKDSKEWHSAIQHEVSSYTAFYEKNRSALAALTRDDIIDIVNYIVSSPTTIDGPNFKLDAFNVFMMAYIVDGARRNFNDWDFSDAEIAKFEEIARKQRSLAGTLLNATAQTMNLVDPIKIISSRALDNYDISQDKQNDLFDAIDELVEAKTLTEQREKATELNKQLASIEDDMLEYRNKQKGIKKNIWQKIKSFRYTAMLSSPVTWIRNLVSNVVNRGLNAAADTVAKFIFHNKGYREGQWNLNDIQVSAEVRDFINNTVLSSDLFDMLYDNTTKYDDRGRQKRAVEQREIFRSMIINALEREFAAGHRFDTQALNNWSKFVDRMISDKTFIKKAATRYLGKILQNKLNNGTVSLNEGLSNEVLNSFADAVVIGQAEYMRKRSPLAGAIDGLRKSSPVAAEILQWWQPFINSSFNWFAEIFKYTPIGLGYSIVQSARLEKKIQKMDEARARGEIGIDSRAAQYLVRKDIGKGVIGMLLLALGGILGAFGIIKIDDDDDKFYMSIGDVKIDISRIFGSSSILTGVALTQDRDAMTTMRDISEILFQDLFLADIIEAGKYNQTFLDYMLNQTENTLKSFVPQIVQLTVRATNNQQVQYSSGFAGAFERYINSFVPTQPMGTRVIDPYTGEPKTKYSLPFLGEFLQSGVLGAQIYFKPVTDTELELANLGIKKGEITGELTQNGVKYTVNKQATNEYYGKLNADSLPKLKTQKHYVKMEDGTYKTLSWNKLTDKQKATVINRTMAQNAEYTKIYQWTKEGHKYYANDEEYTALKKLGITNNVYHGDKGFVE